MTLPNILRFPTASDVPVHHDGKPRILYVITRAECGGAQVHVRDLACAMQEEFDVAVATGEQGFLVDECRARGIPVYMLRHLRRQVSPIADAQALWEIRKLIQQVQPDLLHVHTFKAGFLGRCAAGLLNVPTIYTIHSWLFVTPSLPPLWKMIGVPCERLAARWCERLITVSRTGASIAQEHRIGPQNKIVTIHNGIPDCSERAELEHRSSPVVTMVARFSAQKDHSVLLRAFATIPPGARLRLVGSGPLLKSSQKLVRQLGIEDRVDFLGDREDIASLLASSDVFVLASKFEMFSLSILEAMRAGLPIVASDVGGNGEAIIDDQTGLLVPSGSVEALGAALRRLLDDPALRLRLGRAARQRFTELFQFSQQESLTRRVYEDVLYECRRVTIEATSRANVTLVPESDPRRETAA